MVAFAAEWLNEISKMYIVSPVLKPDTDVLRQIPVFAPFVRAVGVGSVPRLEVTQAPLAGEVAGPTISAAACTYDTPGGGIGAPWAELWNGLEAKVPMTKAPMTKPEEMIAAAAPPISTQ